MPDFIREGVVQAIDKLQALLAAVIAYLPQLVLALILLLVALYTLQRVRVAMQKVVARRNMPASVATLIHNTTHVVGLALAFTITLYALGVNVFGLVAGLGIGGLIIGFALKDIIENMLAGALILIQRPFSLGDLIEASEFKGNVTEVSLRSTALQTPDNIQILIPNTLIFKECVKNFSVYPLRRRTISLDVGYRGGLSETLEGVLATVRGVEGVAEEPAPRIELLDLSEGAIRGSLHYFIDTRQHDLLVVHNEVLIALEDVIKAQDYDLQAYPTYIIVTENDGRQQA